jgi:hypothetical protein
MVYGAALILLLHLAAAGLAAATPPQLLKTFFSFAMWVTTAVLVVLAIWRERAPFLGHVLMAFLSAV